MTSWRLLTAIGLLVLVSCNNGQPDDQPSHEPQAARIELAKDPRECMSYEDHIHLTLAGANFLESGHVPRDLWLALGMLVDLCPRLYRSKSVDFEFIQCESASCQRRGWSRALRIEFAFPLVGNNRSYLLGAGTSPGVELLGELEWHLTACDRLQQNNRRRREFVEWDLVSEAIEEARQAEIHSSAQ